MTGGEPSDNEAIFVRLEAGEETRRSVLTERCSRAGSLMRTERSRSGWAEWIS
jgi:hypothetical protein